MRRPRARRFLWRRGSRVPGPAGFDVLRGQAKRFRWPMSQRGVWFPFDTKKGHTMLRTPTPMFALEGWFFRPDLLQRCTESQLPCWRGDVWSLPQRPGNLSLWLARDTKILNPVHRTGLTQKGHDLLSACVGVPDFLSQNKSSPRRVPKTLAPNLSHRIEPAVAVGNKEVMIYKWVCLQVGNSKTGRFSLDL